jgi:WD40 repeat protein
MGHISAITDLAYSYSGDRILSASQKDGVIRIWSIGTSGISSGNPQAGRIMQTVIKLTNPTATTKNAQPVQRRAPGNAPRPETSKVSCDVAVWTHDDSYIVSSQSVLLKQSGSEIQPGSQYLFLWDSQTGQCLMGFSGAHNAVPCGDSSPR